MNRSTRTKMIFIAASALTMLVFNLRYCQEVQNAERARFEGWVGSLKTNSVPSDLQIEYKSEDGTTTLVVRDEQTRAQALRLMQVLREARVIGRNSSGESDEKRVVIVRAPLIADAPKSWSPAVYEGSFNEHEIKTSPQLQVFNRLITEFAH